MISFFFFVDYLLIFLSSTIEIFENERFTQVAPFVLFDYLGGCYWVLMLAGMFLGKGLKVHTWFLVLRIFTFLYLAGAFVHDLGLIYLGSIFILLLCLIMGSMFSRQYIKLLEENVQE